MITALRATILSLQTLLQLLFLLVSAVRGTADLAAFGQPALVQCKKQITTGVQHTAACLTSLGM